MNYTIKYKNESLFMKILGYILFFNPKFMTEFTTTIGNTIYFPNRERVKAYKAVYEMVLCHEIVHMYDESKKTKFLFKFEYLLPQILSLLAIPLLFIFSWKAALIPLVFLTPLPAFFRKEYEKRGYVMSLYAKNRIYKAFGADPKLKEEASFIVKQFTGPTYYFMWPIENMSSFFEDQVIKIEAGDRSYFDAELYDIVDKEIDQFLLDNKK